MFMSEPCMRYESRYIHMHIGCLAFEIDGQRGRERHRQRGIPTMTGISLISDINCTAAHDRVIIHIYIYICK